ncbi:MAG: hypothetical protein FWD14_02685 [Treponema sp.]|nr:hypothetical protein [Treponema sp.]
MKNTKIICFFTIIFFLITAPVFSQATIENLSKKVNDFSGAMLKSLPFNSTIGLNWSDAYIGKLFPSIPPHFGIGIAAGATTMPVTSLKGLTDLFNINVPSLAVGLPLPAYVMEGRIGGLFLPFDIGVKFGFLNENELLAKTLDGMNIRYQLIGADIRYSLEPGILPIKASIGLGYNRLEGGLSKTLKGYGQSFSFFGNTLNISNPDLGFIWETNMLELKAQISIPLIIITPYAGAGVSYAWSKAGYQVKSNLSVNDGESIDSYVNFIKQLGITNITSTGFEQIIKDKDWNMRLFGGLSLNMALIKLDFTGMLNVRDGGLGFTLGLRFQL